MATFISPPLEQGSITPEKGHRSRKMGNSLTAILMTVWFGPRGKEGHCFAANDELKTLKRWRGSGVFVKVWYLQNPKI